MSIERLTEKVEELADRRVPYAEWLRYSAEQRRHYHETVEVPLWAAEDAYSEALAETVAVGYANARR